MKNKKNFNIRTSDSLIYPVMPWILDFGEEYGKVGPMLLNMYDVKNYVRQINSVCKAAGIKNSIVINITGGCDANGRPLCMASFESIPTPEDTKDFCYAYCNLF